MSWENWLYITLGIIYLLFSGNKKKKQVKTSEPQKEKPRDIDLIDFEEIKRKIKSLQEEYKQPVPPPQTKPVREKQTDYRKSETLKKQLQQHRDTETTSQEEDLEETELKKAFGRNRLEQERKDEVASWGRNYEQEITEAINSGKEIHSVKQLEVITDIDHLPHPALGEKLHEIDWRKAILYSEILKRKEY